MSIITNWPATSGLSATRFRNLPRGDFQIEGVSEELCQRFSKRDAEIDKALAKLLADHPELGGANISELRRKARHGKAHTETKRFEPG